MEISDIKRISIIDYAEKIGFTPVKKGKYYSLKEHDSVIIDAQKNMFWRNSAGISGSVIDFAMHFEKLNLNEALKKLTLFAGGGYTPSPIERDITPKKEISFELPKKADNNNSVWNYLVNTRKIDKLIVHDMIRTKNIYQDTKRNAVFVSYNKEKKADFACVRGTASKKFVADVSGSNYSRCFYYSNKNSRALVINESVIDSMSYMTKLKREGRDYKACDYLSLSGVSKYKEALVNHLNDKKAQGESFKAIVLALDNDKAGIEACEKIKILLKEIGYEGKVCVDLPENTKDWNEEISVDSRNGLDKLIYAAESKVKERNNSPPERAKNNIVDNISR